MYEFYFKSRKTNTHLLNIESLKMHSSNINLINHNIKYLKQMYDK